MSHFSLLVINTKGNDDVEDQLYPFKEEVGEGDPRAVFNDTTDEYKEEYENNTRSEFYCNSFSSWGMQLAQEDRDKLANIEAGEHVVITMQDGGMSYVELNKKYSTYEMRYDEESDREVPNFEKRYWWEVVDIVENESNNPQRDICFKGKVRVRKIEPPKELPLKNFYESFEDFCDDWHGSKPNEDGRYGYFENPNSKWDWYQIGARWAGMLKLKEGVKAEKAPNFSYGWDEEEKQKVLDSNVVDQARNSNIDWESMTTPSEDEIETQGRFWELIVDGEEPKNEKEEEIIRHNFYRPEYYSEKYKTKEVFIKAMTSFSTYAVLVDGEWKAAGEMGWFGVSHDDGDEKVNMEINFYDMFIKDLSDDAMITVVDCHI